MSIHDSLLGKSPQDYGNTYTSDLLELYKLYVSSAEKVSDRRQAANSFYLALNTGLLTALGVFLQLRALPMDSPGLFIAVALVGLAISLLWLRSVDSYRNLNSAKFQVIHAIEEYLPVRLYRAEWEVVGKGEDRKRYRRFTEVERIVPWVFVVVHGVVLALFIPLVTLLQGSQ